MSKPNLLSAYTERSKTIRAMNSDYAEIREWVDGNTSNEDRIGYFVSIDDTTPGLTIVKATSNNNVHGVTVSTPGFSTNKSDTTCDASGNLKKAYVYVTSSGVVPVIDNGTCTVNTRCVPTTDGTAVPSGTNSGYRVLDRIDANHVSILLEPQSTTSAGDMSNLIIGTIPAGTTSVTLNDSSIKTTSLFAIYFEDQLLSAKDVAVVPGSITISINVQDSDVRVGIKVW